MEAYRLLLRRVPDPAWAGQPGAIERVPGEPGIAGVVVRALENHGRYINAHNDFGWECVTHQKD